MNIAAALKPCRHLALLAGLACGLAAPPAQAAFSDPAQIQTEAYVNLVQADQSLDAGRLDEALSLYKTARDYYQQLAKDFPGWDPRVIQYRTTYCENQIADVERRKSGGPPMEFAEPPPAETPEEMPGPPPEAEPVPAPPAETAAAVPAPEPEPEPEPAASDRSVEIDYLKSRIAGLEAQLAESQALQAERDSLAAVNARLRKDLEVANQTLAAHTGQNQTDLDGLRAALAAKDGQIQSLQEKIEAGKQLQQTINELEAKVSELTVQNERLDKEIQTRDGELDETERRLEKAEAKSKKAEERAARELDKIRGEKSDLETQLAALKNQPAGPAPSGRQTEAAPEAQPEVGAAVPQTPKPETKPSDAEAKAAAIQETTVCAAEAKPIPDAMSAAGFVRQLLAKGDNEAALATVRQARQSQPADTNLALIEGIALIRLQRYAEAAALLNELAKNNPHNADIHAAFGAAMMGTGFYEEAREILQMALQFDKNMPECLYNLAQLYAFIDPIDLKLARKYYRQARALGVAADPRLDKVLR